MAGQGQYISAESIRRIVQLLSSTEMTVSEIAERMSCSRSTVVSINRRHQVRQYNGLRASWSKSDLDTAKTEEYSSQTLAKKKSA
jgi:hypothetical protein